MEKQIGKELKITNNCIIRYVHAHVGNIMEQEDLTGMQSWIVGYIYRQGEKEVFQRDIEKEFSIRRSTATILLQKLENKGFLRRESVQRDARLKRLILTDKAIELSERIDVFFRKLEEKIKEDITQEELETVYRVLDKIKRNLEG